MDSQPMKPLEAEAVASLPFLAVAGPLFDSLSSVVFFVKDASARYLALNDSLVQRCGMDSKEQLLGKTVLECFPAPYCEGYYEQDTTVIETGNALRDMLELHLYVQGGPGWCVTTKMPLRDASDNIVGLVGLSSDIHAPAMQDKGVQALSKGVAYIQENFGEALRVDALAERCGLSSYQFEQRMKRVFQLTAGQFINKTRIDAARRLLEQDETPIADIALACGFSDQSAFTRQFKATTGITPTGYRQRR